MNPLTGQCSALNMLNSAELVFWDFDGVIKDSLEVKSRAFENLFRPFGTEALEAIGSHHRLNGGLSRYEKIPLYLEWVGQKVTDELVQEYCDLFSKNVKQAVIDSPWVPGVQEWLLENFQRKYLVLVTATPQLEILEIINALEIRQCFREVFGAPIDKEDSIRFVLNKHKIHPMSTLVVGDSKTDLLAANSNSLPFLLRRTPFNREVEMVFDGAKFEGLINESV